MCFRIIKCRVKFRKRASRFDYRSVRAVDEALPAIEAPNRIDRHEPGMVVRDGGSMAMIMTVPAFSA